jgi:hypothetical protein
MIMSVAETPALVIRDTPSQPSSRRDGSTAHRMQEDTRICVGMATYDDFDGVWFTIQAIRMFHAEVSDRVSFVVVDNHPDGKSGAALKALESQIASLRYVPFSGYHGTAVRDIVFKESDADIVCCVDSHVLLQPGSLASILSWYEAHPDSPDLLQGPLLDDALNGPAASHFAPGWRAAMYGQWALDRRIRAVDAVPFVVGMQGLGLFACRQSAWPGFNPRFRGFGGEEGYLHEKFRLSGGTTWCHPALGWLHRFNREHGQPYPLHWQDILRNYLIGWREIGWDTAPIETHFRTEFAKTGASVEFDSMLTTARREADNPLSYFDGVFCLNLDSAASRWDDAVRRFTRLDIAWQVERFPAVPTPDNHHRGCAISFRSIVAEAQRRGYEHVLILEDDAVFLDDAIPVLQEATRELSRTDWDLCYLGACVWGQTFPYLPGSRVLQACGPVTSTHAVAIHKRAYDQLLRDIPSEGPELDSWISEFLAVDQYLHRSIADGKCRAVITYPRVASQRALLAWDNCDAALADHYQ